MSTPVQEDATRCVSRRPHPVFFTIEPLATLFLVTLKPIYFTRL